eukprot:scaffold5219_cov45-Prasinocladus_malaysianus.AAC.2
MQLRPEIPFIHADSPCKIRATGLPCQNFSSLEASARCGTTGRTCAACAEVEISHGAPDSRYTTTVPYRTHAAGGQPAGRMTGDGCTLFALRMTTRLRTILNLSTPTLHEVDGPESPLPTPAHSQACA